MQRGAERAKSRRTIQEEVEDRVSEEEEEENMTDEPTEGPTEGRNPAGETWFDVGTGKSYIANEDGESLEISASGGFTGSAIPTVSATSRRITSGTSPMASGGMVYTTGTGITSGPFAPGGFAGPSTSKRERFVRMPGRFTKKVLVGFLDPDEKDPSKDVEWAANLPLIDAEMSMRDGKMELVLTLSLEDIYGNNPEKPKT